jgi:hypothetical protein
LEETNDANSDDTYNKHNILCLFCGEYIGEITTFYASKITYIKKPEKHNTNWLLDDEITLLKNVMKNKKYKYICDLLGRTHCSIHKKRENLIDFIIENIKHINDIEKKFITQLQLDVDIDEMVKYMDTDDVEIYNIFSEDEQIKLEKFINNIYIIRSKYLSSKFISKKCIKWLEKIMEIDKINILHEKNDGEYNIPNTLYKVDGYCKETNTIYEFHGCLYHGCNKCFDENSINPKRNIKNIYLYNETIKKEELIKKLGYNLITMWEHAFNSK